MIRIWLGTTEVLSAAGQTRVDREDLRIAVFFTEGQFHAIDDVCSHAEASLAEGEVFDGEVECPRHGATFDLMSGAATCLPATRPVSVYPVTVVDGDVFIDVEETA